MLFHTSPLKRTVFWTLEDLEGPAKSNLDKTIPLLSIDLYCSSLSLPCSYLPILIQNFFNFRARILSTLSSDWLTTASINSWVGWWVSSKRTLSHFFIAPMTETPRAYCSCAAVDWSYEVLSIPQKGAQHPQIPWAEWYSAFIRIRFFALEVAAFQQNEGILSCSYNITPGNSEEVF